MSRFLMTLALVGVSAMAQASGASTNRVHSMNPVIAWNRILLSIVRTPGAQSPTIHPTRSFAILHAAIYDAVNAIDQTHAVYRVSVPGGSHRASQDAAAAAAAHDVLVALYPAFTSTCDAALQQSMEDDAGGGDQAEGIRIGRAVAAQILTLRGRDGSTAQPGAYVFGTAPGDYQSTPPNFPPQPQFTHWAFVTPFALEHAGQFRPEPPPSLASGRYADALNEVEAVGVANSTDATPDEALTGLFWNGPIQNYWNEIAQTAALSQHMSTAGSARLFALVNLSLADGVIAFYDAKYAYNRWRPVTAIQAADIDDNPDTVADPGWLPQSGRTAADPSYPGAHAVISAAAADVLASVVKRDRFDFDVTSETTPGIVRSFPSFSSAAAEASLSRIFAGQHFRFDETAGQRLGREIADFVVDHFLTRIHSKDDRQWIPPSSDLGVPSPVADMVSFPVL
jgi:PAP2 superfamily